MAWGTGTCAGGAPGPPNEIVTPSFSAEPPQAASAEEPRASTAHLMVVDWFMRPSAMVAALLRQCTRHARGQAECNGEQWQQAGFSARVMTTGSGVYMAPDLEPADAARLHRAAPWDEREQR